MREASQLEQGQARVDRMEQHDLKDGPLTSQEQSQIQRAENTQSRDVYMDKHNATYGNSDSASSQHVQHDVQHDAQRGVSQENRTPNGVKDGQINNAQTTNLEGREAHDDHVERRAGANGNVSRAEQGRIHHNQNRASRAIHRNRKRGG